MQHESASREAAELLSLAENLVSRLESVREIPRDVCDLVRCDPGTPMSKLPALICGAINGAYLRGVAEAEEKFTERLKAAEAERVKYAQTATRNGQTIKTLQDRLAREESAAVKLAKLRVAIGLALQST